jgi:hypothetical protein
VTERRNNTLRDRMRRRVLGVIQADRPPILSISDVSATLGIPLRACVRILRSFEAVGLLRGVAPGRWIRRRTRGGA